VHHAQYQEPCDVREEEIYEEGCQPIGEEKELYHDAIEDNEDLIKEHEDEMLVSAPPFDEVIQDFIPPAQEEENVVSHFPFQVFDDTLFYNLEGEEIEEPLDAGFIEHISSFIIMH
jgi:hypothetical protein